MPIRCGSRTAPAPVAPEPFSLGGLLVRPEPNTIHPRSQLSGSTLLAAQTRWAAATSPSPATQVRVSGGSGGSAGAVPRPLVSIRERFRGPKLHFREHWSLA